MSGIYDNWERLVAAVLRRELLWQICHENSRTPSLRSSVSSDIASSLSLSSTFSDPSFGFLNPKPDEIFKYTHSLPFRTFTEGKPGRLQLLEGSSFAFTLEELLMAPSAILGDERRTFRNTYTVKLRDDIVFVAKRLRRGNNISHALFEKGVKTIGCIEHENVVKLWGYYLTEDECFGFYDYFPQGSVYTMLQEQKGESTVDLDWETRMRIAVGAAKGLVHIHTQLNRKLVHGNIKSPNIFLNPQRYGCLADMNILGISSYLDPDLEVSTTKKLSQESDVRQFGVVLIELLSGKTNSNSNFSHRTLADWAIHIARDEWTALVFDKGLLKNPMVKQGMWDVLAVALSCVNKKREERPKMNHVLEELEFIHAKLVSRNFE